MAPVLNKRFREAGEHYRSAAKAAKSLYEGRREYLPDLIESGMAALDAGNASRADESFRFVLLIDPANQKAIIGARRAKTLDEVSETTRKAIVMERAGRLGLARALYLRATNLDQYHRDAMEGLNRVDFAIEKDTYRKLMTDVIHHLTAGDLAAAQKSLDGATAVKANEPAISEIGQILYTASTTKKVQALEEKAVTAEQVQDWQLARHLYEQILGVNRDIKTGQDGKSRTEMIIRLLTQLTHYLDNPDRLLRDDQRAAARLTIDQVERLSGLSGKTKSNAITLSKMIETAEKEIPVTLLSDGETEIAIQNVKRLGKFESNRLSLRPGSYTVTGQRIGYRDVRRTLTIESGGNAIVFTVRCVESIY